MRIACLAQGLNTVSFPKNYCQAAAEGASTRTVRITTTDSFPVFFSDTDAHTISYSTPTALLSCPKPSMFVSSSLVFSHLVAFAALASAQDGSEYAASILSAVENLDTAALASATANLQNSVISALAESTADPSAIVSNVEADISAVLATLDQFTATADPALLSSIEAQASDIGLDFDSLSQLTDVAEAPEETGSASMVSTTDVDPEETSSVIVISGQSSSAPFTTHNDGGASSSSSASDASEAASTSAPGSSTARASTQAESSASGSTTAASASDNLAAAATGLPMAAVGAGLAVLAML